MKRVTFNPHKKGRWSRERVNSGQGPNPVAMAEYKQRILSKVWGEQLPVTKARNAEAVQRQMNSKGFRDYAIDPRLAIELKLLDEQNTHFSHTWNRITMKERESFVIYMYWSGNLFRYVKLDHILERTYESPTYEGRPIAMWAWHCERIKWMHVQPYPPKPG